VHGHCGEARRHPRYYRSGGYDRNNFLPKKIWLSLLAACNLGGVNLLESFVDQVRNSKSPSRAPSQRKSEYIAYAWSQYTFNPAVAPVMRCSVYIPIHQRPFTLILLATFFYAIRHVADGRNGKGKKGELSDYKMLVLVVPQHADLGIHLLRPFPSRERSACPGDQEQRQEPRG
jgi:hypothetical protein